MTKLLYAVDYTEYSVLVGAFYVNGKVTLQGLTEVQIEAIDRFKNRIDALGFNPTDDPEQEGLSTGQLSAIIDQLAAQDPNEILGVLSKSQGKWLHANHPDFMPPQTEEE